MLFQAFTLSDLWQNPARQQSQANPFPNFDHSTVESKVYKFNNIKLKYIWLNYSYCSCRNGEKLYLENAVQLLIAYVPIVIA